MLITTTTAEQFEVELRDIAYITHDNAVCISRLAGCDVIRLTPDSAEEVRRLIAPARQLPVELPRRSEVELFDLAAMFSRRQVFDFRVPGTTAAHKVECVVMELSDVANFASAIGVPSTPGSAADVVQLPERLHRRMSDRVVRSLHLTFDEAQGVPEQLAQLADEYHRRAEAYDRIVCTGRTGPDGIMPANATELVRINRNAQQLRRELIERAGNMGFTSDQFMLAMRRYDHRRPYEVWQQPEAPDQDKGRVLFEQMQAKRLVPTDKTWTELDDIGREYWTARAATEAHLQAVRADKLEQLQALAFELLADQTIAAGGSWPIPGADPALRLAIGTPEDLARLFPAKEGVPA